MRPERTVLHWRVVDNARRLLRWGHDLHQAANALGVRPADLDLSLWRNLGKELPDEGR